MSSDRRGLGKFFTDPVRIRPVFPLSTPRDSFPTSPNDLLYLGRRELRETDQLKSALSTIHIKRDSHPSSSRRAPDGCYFSSSHYSAAALPDIFDYEEDAEESESELFLNFPARHARIAGDSPLTVEPPVPRRRAPNALEEALLRQPAESEILVDDALHFVSDIFCRANQRGSRAASRPTSGRQRSGRARTPRSRNSQTPSVQIAMVDGSPRTVRIEAPS
jgi:hypothetical protein